MLRGLDENTGDGDIALTLGDLGAGLLDAGYAVTDVQQALRAVGQVNGRTDLTIGVLPSAIMVDDPQSGRTRLVNSTGASLTFTQVADVAALANAAELGHIGLGAIRTRRRAPPATAARGSPDRSPCWAADCSRPASRWCSGRRGGALRWTSCSRCWSAR